MPPSPARLDSHSPPRRGAAARLLVAALWATALAFAATGCEYFTSERLARLKPGDALGPAVSPSPAVQDEEEPSSLSAAEVVALLERTIRGNERELDNLAGRIGSREEMEEARDVFQHLDDLRRSLDRERKKAMDAGDPGRAAEIERQAATLERPWTLARERLDLDLRSRTLVLERIEILREVMEDDRRRLTAILTTGDVLRSLDEKAPEPAAPDPTPAEPAGAPAEAKKPDEAPPAVQIPIVPGQPLVPKAAEPASDAAKKADAPKAEEPAKAEGETPKDAAPADAQADAEKAKPALPPSKELVSAKRDLAARSTTVEKLQRRTMTLDARMQSLARSLDLVRELVEVSRRAVRNADQTREYLLEELAKDTPSAAVQAWTHDGGDVLGSLDRRVRAAGESEKRLRARFEEMSEERQLVVDALQKINVRAQSEREGLEKTQETVEALQSPLSSHNIRAWLWANGPPVVGTLVVMSLLYLLVSRYSHKLVELFASRGIRGSKAERDNRMETLVSVLQNTGSVLVLAGGISTLLGQVGIPVGPLLGGAAVAGVAVAFGAQNLIKDFFYGFMILLENQYKLKDIVKIGDHSGQVEQITLRMTALRDGDGGLHFLPNGATTSVINLTHGWSSASFNVRIAWDEDVDRVIGLITDLGKEMRQDPKFRLMIVDDLNMMGVDALTDTAVVILFSIKTLPLQQWAVKREFLKRLKKKFQEKEVKLPPPPPVAPPG
ncbi:mechanosensitive ion channel domain-containing protein [Paludisphaera sp.]|uniref:mechanosensitive ion channel domain-containing protein n=1 Tax=Paludisphaera sp. TaxID=2017432 RepID=UPI00301E48D5